MRPGARGLALVLGTVAVAGGCADVVMALAAGAGADLLRENSTAGDAIAVGYGLTGAYLARARPRNPVGWVLLGIAVASGVSGFANGWAQWPDPLPARTFAAWLASWLWFLGFAPLPTVLVALYPGGHAGRRRRRLVAASALGALLVATGLALSADAIDDVVPGLSNPVAWAPLSAVTAVTGGVVLLPCALLCVADACRRLWRARSPEREQLAWLLLTVVVAVVASYLPLDTLGLLLHALVPVAIAVGVVRHRLLDLQVAVRRALLYAGLTAVVVAVFVATTAALSPVLEQGPVPVAVAAALVAVGLTPARELLQRGVDRVVYGDRHDPLRAVASLARDVAEHEEQALVRQVLGTVAAAVRSPEVVLLDPGGAVLAGCGAAAGGEPLRLPLQVAGRPVGCLLVSPRTARDGWSSDDRLLLEVLARQVALVVHADRLTTAVTASRDSVVAATAAERERLRQELHDGLGPALSGIALGLEAVEAALERAPERAGLLLSRLRAETQAAGREVRGLVEGLRPSALDDRPLDGALRAFVSGLHEVAAGRPAVALELPPALPPMSREVEAAAYRIVAEAVTNVVRHSAARRCWVRAEQEDAHLVLSVEDDGSGLPAQPREGVGLASMRRRASGLGGSWEAGPRAGGGTRIEVRLPLRAAVSA